MILFLESLFFLTITLCSATYALYPLVILIIAKVFPFSPEKSEHAPAVSILISAYNEEKDIRQKIINTLELDYPREKMEIIVGSDGSGDQTVEIVQSFAEAGIQLLECKENRGKTAVQNDLVTASSHDILVFTDAASFLPQDALKNLVQSFSDPRVGAVAGRMLFVDAEHNMVTQGQGLYWKYEMKLRELESSIGRMIGVDGPLYALRKENYIPLGHNIISDLMVPLKVLKQNRKVVLEKNATVLEQPTQKGSQELNTRRRIALRGFVGLFSDPQILSPLKFPFLSLQIILHKLLRWCVGPLVLLNLIACMLLCADPFYAFFLLLHVVFYFSAFIGWMLEDSGRSMLLFKVSYYFCLVNLAAGLGLFDFLMKKQAVAWNPVRH